MGVTVTSLVQLRGVGDMEVLLLIRYNQGVLLLLWYSEGVRGYSTLQRRFGGKGKCAIRLHKSSDNRARFEKGEGG